MQVTISTDFICNLTSRSTRHWSINPVVEAVVAEINRMSLLSFRRGKRSNTMLTSSSVQGDGSNVCCGSKDWLNQSEGHILQSTNVTAATRKKIKRNYFCGFKFYSKR